MLKNKFLKIYSNLPSDERDQIIVVINGKTYSWNRAFDEINKDTPRGKEILDKLNRMGLL